MNIIIPDHITPIVNPQLWDLPDQIIEEVRYKVAAALCDDENIVATFGRSPQWRIWSQMRSHVAAMTCDALGVEFE